MNVPCFTADPKCLNMCGSCAYLCDSMHVWLFCECEAGVCVALVSREIFCNECNYLRGRLA